MLLRHLLAGLLDLAAPPSCAACRSALVQRNEGFCGGCAPLLDRLSGVPRALDHDACLFGGPLRDALHRLKYEGASETAPALAALLWERASPLAARLDCVTAVPLHPRRLRARGYNQSALLAAPLARRLGLRFAPGLLVRVGDGRQVGQGREARTAQSRHAFVARSAADGRSCLVIDDVRTTGATLAAARAALLDAGAREVHTLALARVESEEESGQLRGS